MLLSNLNLLATAPGGVARLRELILTLAVQGKLVPQDPSDEPASELLKKIRAEKDRLIAAGKIKRDKPLAEIAEDEKPFALPEGWEWARLDSLSTIGLTDGDWIETKDQDPNGAVRLLQLADIGDGVFKNKSDRFISIDTCRRLNCTLLNPSDVLIARLPNPIGRACVFPGLDQAAITAVDVAICRIEGALLPEFVSLAINAPTTRALIEGYGKGATRFRVSTGHLKTLPFAVPPTAEQSRIVTRVEELMRLCDALEAKGQLEATQHTQLVSTLLATLTESETPAQLADNWHRIATHFDLLLDRPEAVDALEQTILQLAVRGLLVPQSAEDGTVSQILDNPPDLPAGNVRRRKILRRARSENIQKNEVEFPKSWQATSIQELYDANIIIDYSDGNHGSLYPRSSEFGPVGVTFVSAKDISDGIVNWSSCSKLDSTRAAQLTKGWAKGGDVLLTHNATVGRVALVEPNQERFLLGTSVTFYRTNPMVLDATYLFLAFLSPMWQLQLEAVMAQTTRNQVSIQKQAELRIPLPPLSEQSRIVARVAQLRRLCADLRQRLAASQSTQAHLAEALIANLPS